MKVNYLVELAIVEEHGWSICTDTVTLNDDSGDGHTEGEIWEAASEQYNLSHMPPIAIGLIGWNTEEREE